MSSRSVPSPETPTSPIGEAPVAVVGMTSSERLIGPRPSILYGGAIDAGDPTLLAADWQAAAEALADWTLCKVAIRRDVYGLYRPDGRLQTVSNLTRGVLIAHFRGEQVVALHTTGTEGKVLGLTIDLDVHCNDPDGTLARRNLEYAIRKARELEQYGLEALILDSNGQGGFHVRGWFDRPVDSRVVRWLGLRLIADHGEHGFDQPPEVFPKQAALTMQRPYGNVVRLPGRHHRHRDHWTALINPLTTGVSFGQCAIANLLRVRGGAPGPVLRLFREEGPQASRPVALPGPARASDRQAPTPPTGGMHSPDEVRTLLERLP